MVKDVILKRSSTDGQFVTVRTGIGRGSKVKFGNVTISGAKPSAAAMKGNVDRSTEALARVARIFSKPGVDIRAKKNVPLYSVAEGETEVFIRRLNGITERGRVIDSVFRVID